ncbi:MAG TPA: DUF3037 domain-containing protein [Ktedonobacteraceae bacterium]|jgi:hypothetical protein|nr:DUF3037 domain-containing protein [Ktedonobacteraceae bacterium]
MHARNSYDYALIRLVPCVERGEYINVGVILFCRTLGFLGTLTYMDEQRIQALAPHLDLDMVQQHLDTIALVCAGAKEMGEIGQLSQSERFHWLVSPRSTIIQPSPVHTGWSNDPEATLHHLLDTMVRPLVNTKRT